MLIEAETIPYEPAPLRGERLLVLAPHPDDEVIGCGGLVALHLMERRAVRIVVATDGAAAGETAAREEECRRGVARLGDGAEIEFLRFPDRALDDSASAAIRDRLLAFRPDLVLVPGPLEMHPDHLALSRLFCSLVQRDETLFADLAVTRVAFYEVGQPLRPNALVDISAVADAKYTAIAEHRSQLALRDYGAFARGLNAYRAMTLPPGTKYAEGYFVVELPALRTMPFSELRTRCGPPADVEVTREPLPVSVIVRTKDRPALLREALDSIVATHYPCEIVVIDDGGTAADVDAVAAAVAAPGMRVIHHPASRGRAAAGNAGVEAASNAFIAFLDDDDLFYPEHLATLATAAASKQEGWYTDAVSAFHRPSESGGYEAHARLRLFATDFDRDLLLLDNYIPLPSLLLPRNSFLDAGGFDTAFDLFEDWDFLIRLSQRGPLLRIPKVTCEIRHFEGGSSVVLAAPEGSTRFREAKLQVWRKHAALVDPDVIASVLERQKTRQAQSWSQLVEARGLVAGTKREAARLEREKNELIAAGAETQNAINGYALRVRELEATIAALAPMVGAYEQKTVELERVQRENDRLRAAEQELARARVEVDRLNGLLAMIYRSKSWKLHTLLETLRGRG